MTDSVCVRREEVAEGFGWTGGEGGGYWGAGRRWYTLVPVSPLIKSSLKELERENTRTHNTHTHTLTRGHSWFSFIQMR